MLKPQTGVYPNSEASARKVYELDLSDPTQKALARRLCRTHLGPKEIMALDADRVIIALHKSTETRQS